MTKRRKGDPPEIRDVMEDLPGVLLRILSLADQVASRILDRMNFDPALHDHPVDDEETLVLGEEVNDPTQEP